MSPTLWATGPVTTTAMATIVVSSTITSVTKIWSGLSFQNFRPSSTS